MLDEIQYTIHAMQETQDSIKDQTTFFVHIDENLWSVIAEVLEDELAAFLSDKGWTGSIHCTRTNNDTTFEPVQSEEELYAKYRGCCIEDWPQKVQDYFASFSPFKTGKPADCPARYSIYQFDCTLPNGHTGPHMAHGYFTPICAVWED